MLFWINDKYYKEHKPTALNITVVRCIGVVACNKNVIVQDSSRMNLSKPNICSPLAPVDPFVQGYICINVSRMAIWTGHRLCLMHIDRLMQVAWCKIVIHCSAFDSTIALYPIVLSKHRWFGVFLNYLGLGTGERHLSKEPIFNQWTVYGLGSMVSASHIQNVKHRITCDDVWI